MSVIKVISKRNCECCGCGYAGGKQYGDYQCILPWKDVEFKGLCESCNPAEDNPWFNPKLKCHENKVETTT